FHKYRFGLMIIIFQELKQNWVVKVRLNIEFLQPRKLLKVSSNIWGSLQSRMGTPVFYFSS
ncbi:hypothetical protein EFR49_08980, partial [Latilactobacillus curvatus]|nr:hypothetical protein [Latilactobacillus curvatus]